MKGYTVGSGIPGLEQRRTVLKIHVYELSATE